MHQSSACEQEVTEAEFSHGTSLAKMGWMHRITECQKNFVNLKKTKIRF